MRVTRQLPRATNLMADIGKPVDCFAVRHPARAMPENGGGSLGDARPGASLLISVSRSGDPRAHVNELIRSNTGS